jgi:hypothetical protein
MKLYICPRAVTTGIVLFVTLSVLQSKCIAAQVFIGEPFGEALFDLSRDAVLVADTMGVGSFLKRTDVFKLRDGRLLAITSIAKQKGQPFSIIDLKVSSAQVPLKADTPSTTKVELPER